MSKKPLPSWHLHPELSTCGERFWHLPGSLPVRLYEPTRELFRDGQPVPLEARPFDMLMVLVRFPQAVVTRQLLRDVLWGGRSTVADAVVTKCAGKLRLALGGEANPIVAAVHGVGYRLTVAPRWLSAGHGRNPGSLAPPDSRQMAEFQAWLARQGGYGLLPDVVRSALARHLPDRAGST